MKEINSNLDVIDSRDIISRLEELESDLEFFLEEDENNTEQKFDDIEELESLRKLSEDWSDAGDWVYGAFFINENYFTEYIEQEIKDIDVLPQELPYYIENNIDWDGVAEDCLVDYADYNFDGVTFYCR